LNPKTKYYQVFGLRDNAAKSEIRSAYRKLAMQYHPDKNPDPKAHQLFVDLTEAYHILLNDDYLPTVTAAPPGRKSRSESDRIREAQDRLKQQQFREQNEQDRFFKRLTTGQSWRLFRGFAMVSTVLALLLLIDPLLPSHLEEHVVKSYSSKYNGIEHSDIRYIHTEKDLNLFVENPHAGMLTTDPVIVVERSWLFWNPTRVWYESLFFRHSYPVDFSAINLYPAIPILFLVPAFTVFYRRQSYWFSIAYYFSRYIVLACVIYLLFSQQRWIHLLTFGFL
jgi:hypothetical protein